MALVEMSVVEQRYRAVLAVGRGEPKIVVAAQFGVSRQTSPAVFDLLDAPSSTAARECLTVS